tara:strand:+ start:136 stop:843 length:708 start_codon:yes stop_codon:yes gene_type:complete
MKLLLENWKRYLNEAQELELPAKFALVLKIDPPAGIDKLISTGQQKYSNILPEGEQFTKINKFHVTLIPGKVWKKKLDDELKKRIIQGLQGTLPEVVIDTSQVFLAARETEGRKTLYLKVQNSDALNRAIAKVWDGADPDRYMHLSIANVHGGNPFKSVGDINDADQREQKTIVPAAQQQKKKKKPPQQKKGPNIRAMAMGMQRGGKSLEDIQAQIKKATGRDISVDNIKRMIGI